MNVFPEENQETLISRKELSQYLKVSIPTIHAWDKKGILKPIKIGTRIRYLKSDVEKILNQVKPSKAINDDEDRI
ncbi:hypothetical protein BTO18_10380 [Polaribacter porphyrae]|uniref:Helix-turn-helix domain-containing protein n=1 Tax=Polaribacter porphyrae TaxID=1137780 RepID=A0A2S7WTR5_9FLAO|nr:hypothetical protein BTO18_10380 [Polaribacter porphyrae]